MAGTSPITLCDLPAGRTAPSTGTGIQPAPPMWVTTLELLPVWWKGWPIPPSLATFRSLWGLFQ